MGCDGGSIPRRDEMVRQKKKPEKVRKEFELMAKWKTCALSQQPLKQPIVVCRLGTLYNKEAVIEGLIDKSLASSENAEHIRSLKDVRELMLTSNPAFDDSKADVGDAAKDYNVAQFICPVLGVEMNGNSRFVVLWNCGCVVSEKAMKQVKSDACHKCGSAVGDSLVVTLNGTDEEVEQSRVALKQRRQEEKLAKKAKAVGEAKAKAPAAVNDSAVVVDDQKPGTSKQAQKKSASAVGCSKSDEVASKKPKTIQEDVTKTNTYKSLFTTSDGAKNRPTSHWITYNPLYY